MTAKRPDRLSPWGHWVRRVFPAYWVFLFCVTHFPALRLATPGGDKYAHAVAYGLLTFLMWQAFATFRRPSLVSALLMVAALAAYGALDEITQPLMGRTADVIDWLWDIGGVLAVLVVLAVVELLKLLRRPA